MRLLDFRTCARGLVAIGTFLFHTRPRSPTARPDVDHLDPHEASHRRSGRHHPNGMTAKALGFSADPSGALIELPTSARSPTSVLLCRPGGTLSPRLLLTARPTATSRGLPSGASCRSASLLCVIRGATAGRHWEPSAARKQLARTAAKAGVRRRFAPHQLRHAHAVEMAHEGVPLVVIQRQLGHANLGITSIYLQDRQRRDHPHGPLTTGAGDPGHSWPAHHALARSRAGRPLSRSGS